MSSLQNKTVIVTGASLGVGAATSRAFFQQGANLVLIARGREALEQLAASLGDPGRIAIEAQDVTDIDAFAQVLERAQERFGSVDILINNAGFHARGATEGVSIEDVGRMIDVNLKAPMQLTRLAMPYLRQSDLPAVIQVASLAGRTPVPGSASYSASKFGLRAFSMALAEEMQDSGINFAAVSPGPIDTGFIMDDIDAVSDLTFSQPIVTAEQVAEEIIKLITDGRRDAPMPRFSGYLTTLTYLFPTIGRLARPMLERKGRRTKARLRAQQKG
ncbi:MAG: SDR family NAD(P)-dependent oxidoreductase [Pseudomonadota bacterium]